MMLKNKNLLNTNDITIGKLHSNAIDIQKRCKDILVKYPIEIGGYHSEAKVVLLNDLDKYVDDTEYIHTLSITDWALSQFCQKLGMNMNYYNFCANRKAFDLLDYNMNYWIDENKKPMLFRVYDDTFVRGVLSDKYSIYDTPQVLESFIESTASLDSDIEIVGHYLDFERLHLRCAKNTKQLFSNDDLFGGFTIDSSDVGKSALNISFFIYKLVCKNGLCLPQLSYSINQRHLYLNVESFNLRLKDFFDKFDTFCYEGIEFIKNAKDKAVSLSDKEYFINHIFNTVSMPKKDIEEKVIPLISERYGNSVWGVVNAITEVSQNYSLERRLEFEKRAGKLLLAA